MYRMLKLNSYQRLVSEEQLVSFALFNRPTFYVITSDWKKTMKSSSALIAFLALTLLSLSSFAGTPADHPPMDQASTKVGSNPLLTQKAKVLNVVDVRNYTYLEVTMDKEEANTPIWLAGPTTVVKVGNTVRFDEGMQMVDFHSDSLNRDFANLLLVSHIEVVGEQ